MKTIKLLNSDKLALVDDCDYEELSKHNWREMRRSDISYAGYNVGKDIVFMHTFVLPCEGKREPDHIDGNGLNNQKHNLRRATHQQNIASSKLSKANNSGYKGVGFDYVRGLWKAQIMVNYENKFLGRFPTKEQAALAYNEAAKLYFGEFARLNKLENVV